MFAGSAFLGDLLAALMLLTRLPVARWAPPYDVARSARCVWAYPIVGLVVGVLGSFAYGAAHRIGLPPLLASVWTVAAMMLVTGAMHEDGLADCLDGFGGGTARERKLEIMRDSRIGTYGALGLGVCLAIRIAALVSLANPGSVAKALILASILGRSGLLVLVVMLGPARDDGMASELARRESWPSGAAFIVAAAACLLCLTSAQAVAVMALAGIACLGLTNLARSQVGGYTGDVLGACETIVECVVLTAIACIEGAGR